MIIYLIKPVSVFPQKSTYNSLKNKPYAWYDFKSKEILEKNSDLPKLKKTIKQLKNIKIDEYFSCSCIKCVQTSIFIERMTNRGFVYDERLEKYGFELPYQFKKRNQSARNTSDNRVK